MMKRRWIGHMLPFVPVLAGLVLIVIPATGGLGLLLTLAWPLPIIVLAVRKGSGAASLTATAMAVALFGTIGLLAIPSHRTGDMFGLAIPGLALGALGTVSLLLGAGLGIWAFRRRQPGGKAGLIVNVALLGALALWCLWIALPILTQ